MARDMMLTPDEYMSLMRLITSERESEGASEHYVQNLNQNQNLDVLEQHEQQTNYCLKHFDKPINVTD